MNLIEADRLVRKIAEVSSQRPLPPAARQLAEEHAAAVRETARRLEQCVAMLSVGNDAQALQLAEAPPAVLDLVTKLSFRQSPEWRAACQTDGLTVPEVFDDHAIRRLNEAYAKGIAPNHPLYGQYREAILQHDDVRARYALRAIARLNPADANSAAELERLERRMTAAGLTALAAALADGDERRAAEQVHALEAANFAIPPTGEVWQRGQIGCCREWLREAAACRTRDAWLEAAPRLIKVADRCGEHCLELSAGDATQRAELEAWVSQREQGHAHELKFQRTLRELERLAGRQDEKQVSRTSLSREELRQDIDALARKQRELEQFGRAVPVELLGRTGKHLAMLQSQWEQRSRQFRRWVVSAVTLFALVAAGGCWFLWRQYEARQRAAELRGLREHRLVAAAGRALTNLTADSRMARKAALARELELTRVFLLNESQRRVAAEASLAELAGLASAGFGSALPEQIQTRFDAARQNVAAVADDLRPPLDTAQLGVERQWQAWLGARQQERAVEFEKLVREAGTLAAGLQYDRGPEAVRATLVQLKPARERLLALESPPLPALRVPADLLSRSAELSARVTVFGDQLARWDRVAGIWRQPDSLTNYLDSLRVFQESEFAPAPAAGAAAEVANLNPSVAALQMALLLPGQPDAWAAFQRSTGLELIPPEVMPAERLRFNQLRDEELIHNITLCEMTRATPPRWIYAKGLITTRRDTRRAGQFYDPAASPGSLDFITNNFGVWEYREIGRVREAKAFHDFGLERFVDSRTGTNFGIGVLAVLDDLNRDLDVNPVFRGFLAVQLHDLMNLRPLDWGAHWAPAAAADRQSLRAIGADAIRPGEWLVPGRTQSLVRVLEEHFAKAREVSYQDQARFRHELVRRAMQSGFRFAGYADARGQPVLATTTEQIELWGWAANPRAPSLLFRPGGAGQPPAAVHRPLPFTPLFRLGTERQRVLEETTRALAGPGTRTGSGQPLPPLFGE